MILLNSILGNKNIKYFKYFKYYRYDKQSDTKLEC